MLWKKAFSHSHLEMTTFIYLQFVEFFPASINSTFNFQHSLRKNENTTYFQITIKHINLNIFNCFPFNQAKAFIILAVLRRSV